MASWKGSDKHYGKVAAVLHWFLAVLVIGMLAIGLYMDSMPRGPEKLEIYGLHKSFGISVLAFAIVRLCWRIQNTIPPLPGVIPPWQRVLAHTGHWGLYVLMFAMPLSGWMMSSAAGVPVSLFGWFTLPDLVSANKMWKGVFSEAHEVMAFLLIFMIIGHVGAVIVHLFHQKTNLMKRMSLW